MVIVRRVIEPNSGAISKQPDLNEQQLVVEDPAYALHAPSSSSTLFVSRKDIADHLQSLENKLTTTGELSAAASSLNPGLTASTEISRSSASRTLTTPILVYDLFWSCDKDHIEGASPKVARVTGGSQSELEEPIAIHPASETTTYPNLSAIYTPNGFAPIATFLGPQPVEQRLPLWNQETPVYSSGKKVTLCPTAKKKPTPKSSTSTYRQAYKDLLAVPVIPGVKSEKEKFDGGLYMTTLEGFTQAATFR
ncbi:hypothetical protein BKA70DRAFT_1437158 [Coprinopsis sp. MPI-PUGE-AT-0042]|nr:hypothetical protein BKA70DRAFT_1437158 [Coprinopsis sp. MPI-PUGE-AT-0042]